MSNAVALIGVLLGCSAATTSPALSNQVPVENPTAFELAQRTLVRANTPIYPTAKGSLLKLRQRATEQYDVACEAGEPRACILALVLRRRGDAPMNRLRSSCRAGHHLSCRAVSAAMGLAYSPASERALDRSQGEWYGLEGLTMRCQDGTDRCNWYLVHEECAAGWPRSCIALSRGPNGSPVFARRAYVLARDGCDAGIIDECMLLLFSSLADERHHAATKWCWFTGKCYQLGVEWRERGDPIKARDAYELECQTHGWFCAVLGMDYVHGQLPEPAPGRGRDLLEQTCATNGEACEVLTEQPASTSVP